MVLVAALYMAHAMLLKATGHGLGAPWLLLLVLPGVLAAHLSRRSGEQYNRGTRRGAGGSPDSSFRRPFCKWLCW